jgi:hypothetical protein
MIYLNYKKTRGQIVQARTEHQIRNLVVELEDQLQHEFEEELAQYFENPHIMLDVTGADLTIIISGNIGKYMNQVFAMYPATMNAQRLTKRSEGTLPNNLIKEATDFLKKLFNDRPVV